jgi:hypothetical protein
MGVGILDRITLRPDIHDRSLLVPSLARTVRGWSVPGIRAAPDAVPERGVYMGMPGQGVPDQFIPGEVQVEAGQGDRRRTVDGVPDAPFLLLTPPRGQGVRGTRVA